MSENIKIERIVSARIPTDLGEFNLILFNNDRDEKEHLAYIMGDVEGKEHVLVRVHSECFTGDVLGSQRCDCGEQLHMSIEMIAEEKLGVLVYMRQEGRGIGLLEKLRAYNLQDEGYDTVDANLILGHQPDIRGYSVTAAIIKDLGIKSIRLLTNNPTKIDNLKHLGIEMTERVQLKPTLNQNNERYIRTKVDRMNHLLDLPPSTLSSTDKG